MVGLSSKLINNIADISYEAIPSNAVEATKKQILDTLGVWNITERPGGG